LFLEKIKTKSFPVLLSASLSLLFAFSFPLWSVATNAEVYAFSALLYNAAMLSVVSFYQDPQERRLLIAAFFCGLVLTHHFSAAVVLATLLFTIEKPYLIGLQ
jgi:4-hydroxybenzoate polyprenyltransferase